MVRRVAGELKILAMNGTSDTVRSDKAGIVVFGIARSAAASSQRIHMGFCLETSARSYDV